MTCWRKYLNYVTINPDITIIENTAGVLPITTFGWKSWISHLRSPNCDVIANIVCVASVKLNVWLLTLYPGLESSLMSRSISDFKCCNAYILCVCVFLRTHKSARRDEGGRRDIVYNCFAIRPCLFRDMCPFFRRAEVHTAHINACDDSVNPNRLCPSSPSPSGSWNCLAPLSWGWPANKKKTRSIGQNIIAVVCVPVAFLGSECLAAAAYFLSTRAVSQPARCVTRISATSPYFGLKAVSPTDMCVFLRVFQSIFLPVTLFVDPPQFTFSFRPSPPDFAWKLYGYNGC